jgi:hypothetical protein
MAHDTAGMVAVASGTSTQVKQWCELLIGASIPFVFVEPVGRRDTRRPNHRDLWVMSDDADRARYVIVGEDEAALLW